MKTIDMEALSVLLMPRTMYTGTYGLSSTNRRIYVFFQHMQNSHKTGHVFGHTGNPNKFPATKSHKSYLLP